MACYCFLKEQALQESGSPTRAKPMNPMMTPFPSLDDPATFRLGLRRRESQPTFLWSSRERRGSWPGVLPCRPLQTTPPMGQAVMHSSSVPCTFSMRYGAKNSSSDSTGGHPSTSAKEKQVSSSGRPRGFKWWMKKIGNALLSLCCCIPPRRESHLERKRVLPQE